MIKANMMEKNRSKFWIWRKMVDFFDWQTQDDQEKLWLLLEPAAAVEDPHFRHIMVAGGIDQRSTEIFSISGKSWKPGPTLPHCFCQFEAVLASDGREILIFGGLVVDGYFKNSVVSLNIPSNKEINPAAKWSVIPGTRERRKRPGVGVVDGMVFVVGGNDSGEYLKSTEVFSTSERTWLKPENRGIPPEMPTGRYDMAVAVIGRRIFVVGGFGREGVLSKVDVLDLELNKWTALPPLKTARQGMGVAVVDNRFIWTFGGFNCDGPLDVIEIFDAERCEWSTSRVKMTSKFFGAKAVAVNHKIYVIGQSSFEYLDVNFLEWHTLTPTSNPRLRFSATCF